MPEIPAAPEGSQDANAPRYRYADYLRASGAGVAQLSLNRFIPSLEIGAAGQPLPHRPAPLRLRPYEVARILQPYVSVRFNEQLRAVVPLALYLVTVSDPDPAPVGGRLPGWLQAASSR
jgi:hypothetical protein